jgi:hypothetical protein
MTDFTLLDTNEQAWKRLVQSEILRHGPGIEAEINDKLVLCLWYFRHARYLRKQAKVCYSTALKAGRDKKSRETWRQQAIELEKNANDCVNMLRKLDDTIGNLVDPPTDKHKLNKCDSSMVQVLSSLVYVGALAFTYRRDGIELALSWLNQGGILSATVKTHDEILSRRVIDALPVVEILPSSPFASIMSRFYYDANHISRNLAFDSIKATLQHLYHLDTAPENEVWHSIPPSRLDLTSSRSCTLKKSSSSPPLCRISCEADFLARRLDIRINKRVRGKLVVSPFPFSIRIELFVVDKQIFQLQKTDLNSQSISHRNSNENTSDVIKMIRLSIESLEGLTSIDLIEDILEENSFIGCGWGPCSSDKHLFNQFLAKYGQKIPFPIVQYPCLHRWFKAMSSRDETLDLKCETNECKCMYS